jgi:phosphatidylglycerophosphate synthase
MFPWTQIIAPFLPVNESYWEHSKLAVVPLTVYFIIEYFYSFKNKKPGGSWAVSAATGLWSAVVSMFVIHATLIAAFGDKFELVFSIITFILNIWIGMSLFHYMQNKEGIERCTIWSIASLLLLYVSLIVYSYWPLPIELFKSKDYNYFGQNYPW